MENEEYSTERRQLDKQQKMAVESLTMSSEQTPVRKSYLGRISSVILRKLSSVLTTVSKTLQEKSVLQLYLGLYSPPTPTFHICERCGERIPKPKGCSVCHSRG